MPVKTSTDSKGCFAQWGDGEKYYYECNNAASRKAAEDKANAQGQAAYASGYKASEDISGVQNPFVQEIVRKLKKTPTAK